MSMTENEARYEDWLDDLYREQKDRAVAEFSYERLTSFYVAYPLLAQPPIDALAEASLLLESHTTAAHTFASIAVEVGLKVAILKPIVHGLIHSESTAEIIADLTLRSRFDCFERLLSRILKEHTGIDLETQTRVSASKSLWSEVMEVQKCRDRVMHRAEQATIEQAKQAIAVAEHILKGIFPKIVLNLGLHLHDDVRICKDPKCRH